MKKLELQFQAEELQKQLNALSEKIANCKDEPKVFPQKGELYWYYTCQGGVYSETAFDSNGTLDAYRTEAEAEKAVKIKWAKHRVAHKISVLNDGWIPDWNNKEDLKFYIRYWSEAPTGTDYCLVRVMYPDWMYWTSPVLGVNNCIAVKSQPDWMYCKSLKIAKQIIEECFDDLLLIFSE